MKKTKGILKRLLAVLFSGALITASFSCGKPSLIEYEEQDFVFFGFWSPNELTEESFTLYKQSGLNAMLFTNHSVFPRSSDTLHYLGSNATKRSLELCKSVGLNAILNYGYWYKTLAEGESFSQTPFSDYDIYGGYKDIIVGMHVADEPKLEQIADFGNDALTNDYKSVYDAPYMVNLFPNYAGMTATGPKGYKNYLQTFADEVLSDFDSNRLLSVDFYPFRKDGMSALWLACYNDTASVARDTQSMQSYYIQTAVGNEFANSLGEAQINMQINVAMAFGADWFGFYCYEMPRDNASHTPMYEYCMLNADGTPSPLYFAVQSEIKRVSAFSDAYLSYNWQKTAVAPKGGESENQAILMLGDTDFSNTAINNVAATEDTVVGCFNSDKGEAFMVVNYGDPSNKTPSDIEIEFSKGKYVAIYGEGVEPEIVKLKNGKLNLELLTGEGLFITLLG